MTPEKKYLNNSFAIRYDNFRKLKSKYILSKIFWSSYFRYVINHDMKSSVKYLPLISFGGMYECFSHIDLQDYKSVLLDKINSS